MIRAVSVDLALNLSQFSQRLTAAGIVHRVVEESGRQTIWVYSERDVQAVKQQLAHWLKSALGHTEMGASPADGLAASVAGRDPLLRISRLTYYAFRRCPLTWMLMTACIGVALLSGMGSNTGSVRYLFYPLLPSVSLFGLLAEIDNLSLVLRTLTPMLLHFGELHLVFNLLWLWYFGQQLENMISWWEFALLVTVTAFVGNTAQYWQLGYNNFGGMSGVIYGLVGFVWVLSKGLPNSGLLISTKMFIAFVAGLILMETFASSSIATAAHVGGLFSGLMLGVTFAVYYRFVRRVDLLGRPIAGREKGRDA
tara:strand:+ start:252 stop:1181 length:930 start_codon:yes stop_codon:yes gene_type:complete